MHKCEERNSSDTTSILESPKHISIGGGKIFQRKKSLHESIPGPLSWQEPEILTETSDLT